MFLNSWRTSYFLVLHGYCQPAIKMSSINPLLHTPLFVDHFPRSKSSYKYNLYFLTHAHTDHTEGLSETWNRPIYMTDVTKALLLDRININTSLIKVLEVNRAHHIQWSDNDSVCVTPIDANHCPGAVMYLFEGSFGTVLHTGDFRYEPEMISDTVLASKHIDCVYLDGTYSDPLCTFPSRHMATKQIVELIEAHKGKVAKIAVKGLLGKEMLFLELARTFKCKIGVSPKRLNILNILYSMGCLPPMSGLGADVSDIFTCDTGETSIHVIEWVEFTRINITYWTKLYPTIVIAASASYQNNRALPPRGAGDRCIFHVPYSDHSSYNELCDFMKIIQPHAYICIIKPGKYNSTAQKLFNKYLKRKRTSAKKGQDDQAKQQQQHQQLTNYSDVLVDAGNKGTGYMTKVSLLARNQKPVSMGVKYSSTSTNSTPPHGKQGTDELMTSKQVTSTQLAESEMREPLTSVAVSTERQESKEPPLAGQRRTGLSETSQASQNLAGEEQIVDTFQEAGKSMPVTAPLSAPSSHSLTPPTNNTSSTGISSSSGTVLSPSSDELIKLSGIKLDISRQNLEQPVARIETTKPVPASETERHNMLPISVVSTTCQQLSEEAGEREFSSEAQMSQAESQGFDFVPSSPSNNKNSQTQSEMVPEVSSSSESMEMCSNTLSCPIMFWKPDVTCRSKIQESSTSSSTHDNHERHNNNKMDTEQSSHDTNSANVIALNVDSPGSQNENNNLHIDSGSNYETPAAADPELFLTAATSSCQIVEPSGKSGSAGPWVQLTDVRKWIEPTESPLSGPRFIIPAGIAGQAGSNSCIILDGDDSQLPQVMQVTTTRSRKRRSQSSSQDQKSEEVSAVGDESEFVSANQELSKSRKTDGEREILQYEEWARSLRPASSSTQKPSKQVISTIAAYFKECKRFVNTLEHCRAIDSSNESEISATDLLDFHVA